MSFPGDRTPPDLPSGPATSVRFFILLLLSFAPALAYLTRTPAAMATTIQTDFELDPKGLGDVLAGFALGYFWFQIPGGWFANRYGVRIALPFIATAWSLCALWASRAESVGELHAARVALGLAQAGLVPCCARALGEWFPDRERGLASACITMSMQIGGALALGLTGWLLPVLGWREILAAYAGVGLLWVAWFAVAFRNRPSQHPRVNAAEAELIEASHPDRATELEPSGSQHIPPHDSVGKLASILILSLGMWAISAQAFFRAFAYEFFSTWFPYYLENARAVTLQESSMLGMLPIITTGVGSLIGGLAIDFLFRRTGNKRLSRSGTAVLALTMCAGCVLAAAFVRNTNLAVAIIAAGQLFAALAAAATWAATLDISGRHTALVFAVMNTIGNLGSYACPKALGYLVDYIKRTNGDWNLVLYLFVGINLAGAACWLVLDPDQPVTEGGE